MTREYHPALISLDIYLPDMEGWRILDRLKTDLSTRHIPVCVVSTDDSRERALQAGALAFLAKPLQSKDVVDAALARLAGYTERRNRKLLLAMPDTPTRRELLASLDPEVETVVAGDAAKARAALAEADCLLVDSALGGLSPQDVADAIEQRGNLQQLPVVLYNGGLVDGSDWNRRTGLFGLREARTMEALLDDVAFFLHRDTQSLNDAERRAVESVHASHRALEGKKALIVDDDMRNIFALATVLDEEGMLIVSADNGRDAIRMIEEDPSIDIVLMDVMMPEMDGLTTTQEVRKLPRGKNLPIVAVTAKAMKGDRQKCIEAGAWDYLSKPVDPTNLLAVLRGWLCN
jgi:CheY-like chemotaxis protein